MAKRAKSLAQGKEVTGTKRMEATLNICVRDATYCTGREL